MSTWKAGDRIQAKHDKQLGTVKNAHHDGFGIKLGIDWDGGARSIVSEDNVWHLWEACSRCNYDQHQCPGCGANLPHGTEVCAECQNL